MSTNHLKILSKADTDDALQISYADIETMKYLPDNFKAHDLDGIRALIIEHGFVESIVVNKTTGHDVSGNGRLEVLLGMLSDGSKCPKGIIERFEPEKSLKANPTRQKKTRKWYAPITTIEITAEAEVLLAAGMNRTGEKGGIDNIKAFEVLNRLRQQDPNNLVRAGYDEETLERIQTLARFHAKLQSIPDKEVPAADNGAEETPESRDSFVQKLNEKWKVKYGDAYKIGQHYLRCLDSADIDGTGLDQKVRLCFTSPPYDNQRAYEQGKIDWTSMMVGISKAVFKLLGDPAEFVVLLGPVSEDSRHKEYWRGWQEYCDRVLGHPVYGFYIWDKLFGYPGNYHGRLGRCHEFFFHFSIGHKPANKWIETTGESLKRGPIGHQLRMADSSLREFDSPATIGQMHKIPDSVIRMNADMTRGIHTQGHPAIFPVGLAEYVIKTWSRIGDLIYDPFGGSGSTMIACENLDRKCLMSEISPNYVALCLERMSTLFPELKIKRL